MKSSDAPAANRTIEIELLALDLSSCGRCTKTDDNLDDALRTVSEVFEAAEVEVRVTKTVVRTAAEAERLATRAGRSSRATTIGGSSSGGSRGCSGRATWTLSAR